jgi:hypothetical protein
MSSYSVTLRRRMPQKAKSLDKQVAYLVGVALRGERGGRQGWRCTRRQKEEKKNGSVIYKLTLYFVREGRKVSEEIEQKQWEVLLGWLRKAGAASKFGQYPWEIIDKDASDEEPEPIIPEPEAVPEVIPAKFIIKSGSEVKDVLPTGIVTVEQLRQQFPRELLGPDSDRLLSEHEYFRDIYGRNAQIRNVLSTVWSYLESNATRRNHVLLYGLPACAKTQILKAVCLTLGDKMSGAWMKLDTTATTKAGLEKIFLQELKDRPIPPVILCEEIEKAPSEEGLNIWINALHEDGEVRKVNFNQHLVRPVNFLCLGTANDMVKFNLLCSGRPNYPGALSSRYPHQYECPRPDEKILRLILQRDIRKKGGLPDWVDPAIKLALSLQIDDPRTVLGYLDGGDRLLDESYQKDILACKKKP